MRMLGKAGINHHVVQKKEQVNYLSLAYLMIVILCANEFLNLGGWTHLEGRFNVRDVGNALIMLGVLVMVARRPNDIALRSPMSVLIILFLFIVLLHVSLASFVYGQPIKSGLLSARHQFYYLSYFLFLMALNTPLKIERFLNMLTLLAVVIIFLSLVNYAGITIFVHKWGEGHGERFGVTRAFIPAMNVLGVAALWEFSKFAEKGKFSQGGIAAIILFAAHVFRQTRMRTVGLLAVVLFMLVQRRKWGTLAIVLAVGIFGTVVLEVVFDKQVLTSQVTSAFTDVREGEGTWRGRISQIEFALEAFKEHPIIGSGAAVLRPDTVATSSDVYGELRALQYKADLGYIAWLKSYGVVGVIWLAAFYLVWWKSNRGARKKIDPHMNHVTSFSSGFLLWLMFTFLTLNHFMYVGGIIMLCAGAAIAVRLSCFKREQFNA